MTIVLSHRDRRALLLGVALIASAFTLTRGLPSLWAWRSEVRIAAAELVSEAERATTRVNMLRVSAESLAARGRRLIALAPMLIAGETPSAASGELASLISGMAALSGVRLGSLQVQADTSGRSTFVRVRVRGSATADIRGLTEFLSAVERGPAILAIRELSITQPEPAAASDRPETLRMEFVVEGLALARARGAER